MNDHYQRDNLISASAAEIYKALTEGFRHWWAEPDNEIEKISDEVTFRFPPNPTHWTMRVEKLVPNQTVALRCIEANHVHEGHPESIRQEWLDSLLEWRIIPREEKTLVRFKHIGLVPSLQCYEICEAGWDHFFMDSLKRYLEGKAGNPGHIENK